MIAVIVHHNFPVNEDNTAIVTTVSAVWNTISGMSDRLASYLNQLLT